MTPWELPQSLCVCGIDYAIRTDFRVILDILMALGDPELDDYAKTEIMIKILYEDYEEIPPEAMQEAAKKAAEFIDCGLSDDGKQALRTFDWEQDAGIIIPAINSVAGHEVRADKYMHWWTFLGCFMEIRESVFSTIQGIRYKKAKKKKLEKWEIEFCRENRALVELKEKYTQEELEEQERLMQLLG